MIAALIHTRLHLLSSKQRSTQSESVEEVVLEVRAGRVRGGQGEQEENGCGRGRGRT